MSELREDDLRYVEESWDEINDPEGRVAAAVREFFDDPISAVRAGVESGTIKGEVVRWCANHRNEAWEDDRTFMRCIGGAWIEGANAWDCHIVSKLLIPVSDGGSQ